MRRFKSVEEEEEEKKKQSMKGKERWIDRQTGGHTVQQAGRKMHEWTGKEEQRG